MENEKREYSIPEYYNLEQRELALTPAGYSPNRASEMLGSLGYSMEDWKKIEEKKLGSHETRALVRIARGNEIHLIGILASKIREEEGTRIFRDKSSLL